MLCSPLALKCLMVAAKMLGVDLALGMGVLALVLRLWEYVLSVLFSRVFKEMKSAIRPRDTCTCD